MDPFITEITVPVVVYPLLVIFQPGPIPLVSANINSLVVVENVMLPPIVGDPEGSPLITIYVAEVIDTMCNPS